MPTFPMAALAALLITLATGLASPAATPDRDFDEGNFADAYDGYRQQLLADDGPTGEAASHALQQGVRCLGRLNRIEEFDAFVEAVVAARPDDWRRLHRAAMSYVAVPHQGRRVDGEFRRGWGRGRAAMVDAAPRDRVRALQLFQQAFDAADAAGERGLTGELLIDFADAVLRSNQGGGAWRLQLLTDLTTLPDAEPRVGFGAQQTTGAPVDAQGEPLFYGVPASWAAAASDGERWRWLLAEAERNAPGWAAHSIERRAEFCRSQFGVPTLGGDLRRLFAGGDGESDASILALHTLEDDETIARLATGVRRFKLPDEHNHLRLYQRLLAEEPTTRIAQQLATLLLDRRQFPRAAEHLRLAHKLCADKQLQASLQAQLDQIIKPWGQFERVDTQPAGAGAEVGFRFRNATGVALSAKRIDVAKLLSDVKAYLRESPKQLDWRRLQIDRLGADLLDKDRAKYVGQEVAAWRVDLQPADDHFDKQTTLTTPLQDGGAYLVEATVDAAAGEFAAGDEPAVGSTCYAVLWVADTAIVRKPLGAKELFFVADAKTGRPVPGATLELFGYRQQRSQEKPRAFSIATEDFAVKTSADGTATIDLARNGLIPEYSWMAVATTDQGRRAYLGFDRFWIRRPADAPPTRSSAYVVTDRPVYRPEQTVQFKAWVQRADYGDATRTDLEGDASEFAHKAFRVELFNPKQEKVLAETITANGYGGLAGEYALPAGATLGVYRLVVDGQGSGAFRVEEYKKPEFEVEVVAPDAAVALGDKFEATVRATYFFGSPVTSGTVRYKVTRTARTERWYPPTRWDWLYGTGYGWFGGESDWYPGWSRWGCGPPMPPWFNGPTGPPEVVAQGVAPLDAAGEFRLDVDTTLAKQLHGDRDHSYRVEAEVVDGSRRTITGSGVVTVARQPFRVHVWLDRGHYRVGDPMTVSVAAMGPNGEPATGLGKFRLLTITYPDGPASEPRETEVREWELPTGADGRAELKIKASEPGRYRIAYELSAADGEVIEGAQLVTVAGEGFDASGFAFADLELTPDQRAYRPGDKLQLRVSTNRTGATVLLFVRAAGGVYPSPRVLRLEGKSQIVELDVAAGDAPNFFVEAVTVADGRRHRAVREIAVPPESRLLNVEVLPSAEAYLPGQEATVKLRLTNAQGEPFVGETIVAVYDKAVEAIAGGSNVPDIRKHFWSWRRSHNPGGVTSLDRATWNLTRRGESAMGVLGRFGRVVPPQGTALRMSRAGGAMPAPQAPVPMMALAESTEADAAIGGEARPAAAPAAVRQNFADTACWAASLVTDASGLATVSFPMPENLSAWKVRVWGMGHGARVGEGNAEVVTRKNLLVRLQTPRFLVERDEVVLSANVHNYLDTEKQVRVRLELDGAESGGGQLQPLGESETTVRVPPGADRRVDWRLKAMREGDVVVRALALTDEESDAVQLTVPVRVRGARIVESFTGVIGHGDRLGAFEFTVPEQRRADQTRLEVRYSPTLAATMLDALPYLIDYPHGCTEQTLNRFLPAVVARKTLTRLGLDLEALAPKEPGKNNDKPNGEPSDAWRRAAKNPVFDAAELDRIVAAGVRRLQDMQLADGGWGWFSGYGERSSAHTTAVVVRGLLVARENDVAIVPGVVDRGLDWLARHRTKQIRRLADWEKADDDGNRPAGAKRYADNLDALVHAVLCQAGRGDRVMRDRLYRDRNQLTPYGLALVGQALATADEGGDADRDEQLAMVIRNLKQRLVTDNENQTAYLNLGGASWWWWHGSEYETQAALLKLLSKTEPQSEAAAGLVKYLVANRRHATYWNSTRDTALVIEAMADYLLATGEGRPEQQIEVWLDGQRQKTVAVTGDNLLSFDNRYLVEGADLEPGRHTLELRKQGGGRLFWNASLENFTRSGDLRAAGLDVRVGRRFFKLTPKPIDNAVTDARGAAVSQRGEAFMRTEVTNLASVASGDLVEVELTLASKNDYEYLLLSDTKAAGFEPVDLRSGYTSGGLGAYVEFRDQEVHFFLRRLARGERTLTYRLRAETPGKFSALPAVVGAMYAPELRGNSDSLQVNIAEAAVEPAVGNPTAPR